MALSISNAAVQEFQDQFSLTYQSVQSLDGMTMVGHGHVGDAYKIPFMGQVAMHPRGAYQSIIAATDTPVTRPIVTFSDWTLNIPLDKFQSKLLLGNTLESIANTQSKSQARRVCQTKLDALEADAGTSIPDGGTNLTVDKMKQVMQIFDDAEVPDGQRYWAMNSSQIKALLSDNSVTSILYNQSRTLVNGEIDTFLGFKIIKIGAMALEGGLPKTGNIRTTYAWAMGAVYTGYRIDPQIDVDWSAERQSWLTISDLAMGTKVTQPLGVAKIDCDESV